MADFSRRRNHEFLTKLYKHHYVYLMHLIHNWIDSRLPQIYRSIPRVISNIIGNRVKGSILSFEDQDRLFRRGWKKVVSRVSERLNGIIKQEHRHGRDPRKATDRDYDPGAWRRPDPRKESVVLRNNLERIRRQETNPPPRHFSRVRDSFHDSIASIARPLIGRRPTPSTILRTRIVATPSIFLRGIPAQYTNLYFSFGRAPCSDDRSIEIGGSKLNHDDDDCGIKVEGMSKIGAETIHGTKIALSRDRGRFVERAEVAATLFPREKRPFPSRGIN